MGIAQIASYHVEGGSVWLPFVIGKADEPFQRGSSDAHSCLALDVERQDFAVGWQAQVRSRLLPEHFSDMKWQLHGNYCFSMSSIL